MTSVNDIRKEFLTYFEGEGHTVVPSGSLVPANDPTLMFTNAGMVPFKNVFTGLENRPYVTAASSQKCVRAGGKHNDLDNVGYTARHHTFFEMLGNFSFGDYFKEKAIFYAWELLTKNFGLSPDGLLATVFHEDEEAYGLWQKISGLPDDRIIKIPTHDNFWAMGDTGPCGPCSEIFYDHGDHLKGGPPGSKGEDGERFVEIWNLVFMQFDQIDGKTRKDLPKPSIDTGMGLERIAAVLQGTHDNYEIDTFKALIAASVNETGVKADGRRAASHRVIADHLRASAFLLADGVTPSNEGRGYVLRRIMRRAMRHGNILGVREPLLYKLVPALVAEMGQAYPELGRAEASITDTLRQEELRFDDALDRGLKELEKEKAGLKEGDALPGAAAFKLYDTYGFPLDLTQDALKSEGISVDTKGFDKAMEKQKAQARAAWKGSGEQATEEVWFEIHQDAGATEFLGYDAEDAEAMVVALVKGGKQVKKAGKGDEVTVVVNQSPFYGEAGGQIGDSGTITSDGAKLLVSDTQKKVEGLLVHAATVSKGNIAVGDVVHLSVDHQRRLKIRANHSATHLLHKALKVRLGDHVTQKGSLVAEDHLRFDIAHGQQITKEELAIIEADVNAMIRQNAEVSTRLMAPGDAIKAGALALFGEKYGDEVRVLSMGADGEKPYSVELCGGTHVKRTGDIALFRITGESAIGAGIRRIEALTGEAARQHMLDQETKLKETAVILKSAPREVAERVAALIKDKKGKEEELVRVRKDLT
ncbi:MAG: alanine--tRNA ligase, partial [Sphingomonadales bacterium]